MARQENFNAYFYYGDEEALHAHGLVVELVERIAQTFQRWSGGGRGGALSGRAKAIVPRIDKIINELYSFEKGSDSLGSTGELFVRYIVSPLIREGIKLRADIVSSKNPLPHEMTSHYILWIDRSYRWINRFYTKDVQELGLAVVDHIICETAVSASKDLKLIHEYIEQQIATFDIGFSRKEALFSLISDSLEALLIRLKGVEAEQPENREPTTVYHWRERTEALRQQLFDECLEVVDRTIEKEFPRPERKEMQGHLRAVLEKILSLENNVQQVVDSLSSASSQVERWQNRRKILALHQQAHKISLDIRLSQELFDRVQMVMAQLVKYYESL